ncbi:MAG: hypothetical protein BGO93_23355 [Mesorhizobium sp. 65-26]|uniref:GNAT family N-acetyltransferase n=2 Tax=unclassified Mesorhizobium TaxID=325217 RepID=UPI00096929EB|nr:GNAT family N-acetyltransferase [Mesorhizobium sp. 65-26]OJX82152.1 MAG: hypothetical protein BGO93_23355 [Mesorhizobium sp. 65-26]
MMTDIVLRCAMQRDAEALSTFAAGLFRETYAADTAASDLADYIAGNFGSERQRAEIVDPRGVVLLAVKAGDQDAILGYAHLVMLAPGEALLNRLYVEAGCRGTGLAGRLLDALRGECRQRGAAGLRLTVFEKNARAIAFYRRSGFADVGTIDFTVGEDVQRDIEMLLPIEVGPAALT